MRLIKYIWDRTMDRVIYGGQFKDIIDEAYWGDLRVS